MSKKSVPILNFVYNHGLSSAAALHIAPFVLSPVALNRNRMILSPTLRLEDYSSKLFLPTLHIDDQTNAIHWGSNDVLALGLGHSICTWNAENGAFRIVGSVDYPITSIHWVQGQTMLAVGLNQGTIILYDPIQCRKLRSLSGHHRIVSSFSSTTNILTSGSYDSRIYHRDIRSSADFDQWLDSHTSGVFGLEWNSEQGLLASGGDNGEVNIWERRSSSAILHLPHNTKSTVKALAWSPFHKGILATGGGVNDGRIRIFDIYRQDAPRKVDTGSSVTGLLWSNRTDELISTHGDSNERSSIGPPSYTVQTWGYSTMSIKDVFSMHRYKIVYLAHSPDREILATISADQEMRFWNLSEKRHDVIF